MIALFNQYSFVFAALIGGILLAVGLWRWQRLAGLRPVIKLGALAVYVVVALAFNLALRYPASPDPAESLPMVEATLSNDRPTFVMLYSNY